MKMTDFVSVADGIIALAHSYLSATVVIEASMVLSEWLGLCFLRTSFSKWLTE